MVNGTLTLVRGDDQNVGITVKNPDNSSYDLTGCTLTFVAQQSAANSWSILTKAATITNPTGGLAQFVFVPNDTNNVDDLSHPFVIRLVAIDGKITTLVNGEFSVLPGALGAAPTMTNPPSIALTTPIAPFASFQVANPGVYSLNGINGYVNIVGAGNVAIGSDGGQTIIVSGVVSSGAGVTQGQLDSLSGWSASATNLAATGSYLFSLISGGGVSSINGAAGPLTFAGTGAITITQQGSAFIVSGVSGVTPTNLASTGQQAWVAGENNALNLSGNLTTTGATLFARDTSISGGLEARLSLSGYTTILYASGVSGGLQAQLGGFATNATVAATGQQAWTAADTNARNLSGNLTQTGALLSAVKVTGSNLLQVANFSGLGGTLVIQSGSFVLISGAAGGGGGVTQAQLDSLSGYSASAANLFTTGATLVTLNLSTSGALVSLISAAAAGVSTLNGLSGVLTLAGAGGNLFVSLSGQTVYVSGSGIAQTSSLVATGGLLVTSIANVSGGLQSQVFATGAAGVAYANATFATITNLGVTGSTLYGLVAGLSGQSAIDYATKIALASTGQQAWNAATNNALNLSGNLTQTGINLAAAIATSGAAAVAYTDTRVAATGAASDAYTNAVSGGLQASVFATGAATITYGNTTFATIVNLSTTGGNLSAVKVTGSSIVPVANLSGIGGTLVLLSGGFVLISGSAGAAGVVDHGDGINLSGQLTLTGQTLFSVIASTGQQAWTTANNNGSNLSGNLALTGAHLSAIKVTGSSILQVVNLTGIGGTLVIQSGGFVLISGASSSVGGITGVGSGVATAAAIAVNTAGGFVTQPPFGFSYPLGTVTVNQTTTYRPMSAAGVINGYYIRADVTGILTVDLLHATNSGSFSSVTASAPVALSGANYANLTNLIGWTTTYAAGDIFQAKVLTTSGTIGTFTITFY